MIDLSADPPPHNSRTPRTPRRQLLFAGLCGLVAGAGGAWTIVSLTGSDRLTPAASSVAASEPMDAPGEFVDLATVGPTVTVSMGRSGRCAVTVGATISYGSSNDGLLSQGGAMSFEVTGANQKPPNVERPGRSFLSIGGIEDPFSVTQSFSATTVLEGLRPGLTTFTAKYRAEGGAPVPVFFSDRTILVTPLGAETS